MILDKIFGKHRNQLKEVHHQLLADPFLASMFNLLHGFPVVSVLSGQLSRNMPTRFQIIANSHTVETAMRLARSYSPSATPIFSASW